ncbi:hypothetical protein HDU79_011381 [Rhizoclosmatium sp. JEL0117]|nr:hypothetical protein HDU79_011381 [Rhizoclosmatium sp. JEL0117]
MPPTSTIAHLTANLLQASTAFNSSLENSARLGQGLSEAVIQLKEAQIRPSMLDEQTLQSRIESLEAEILRLNNSFEVEREHFMSLQQHSNLSDATLRLVESIIQSNCAYLNIPDFMVPFAVAVPIPVLDWIKDRPHSKEHKKVLQRWLHLKGNEGWFSSLECESGYDAIEDLAIFMTSNNVQICERLIVYFIGRE